MGLDAVVKIQVQPYGGAGLRVEQLGLAGVAFEPGGCCSTQGCWCTWVQVLLDVPAEPSAGLEQGSVPVGWHLPATLSRDMLWRREPVGCFALAHIPCGTSSQSGFLFLASGYSLSELLVAADSQPRNMALLFMARAEQGPCNYC